MKSGRSEKDLKGTVEGSPSAKGTLDNYLVTSEDDNNNAKASYTARDSLSRQDAVKRNLALEINNSSKDEQMRPSSQVQLHSEAVEVAKKEAFREVPVVDDVSVGGLAKGCSTSAQAVENPELKKFAADFLSLYCRYCTINFGHNFLYASFTDVWRRILLLLFLKNSFQ